MLQRGDEHYLDPIFFLESDLVITRVVVEAGE
jgi:hypothetical protein